MWNKNQGGFKDKVEKVNEDDELFCANIKLKKEKIRDFLMEAGARAYLNNDFCRHLTEQAKNHGINCDLKAMSTLYVKKEGSRKSASPFLKHSVKCSLSSSRGKIYKELQ